MAKRKYDWQSVDWTRRTNDIAKEFGVAAAQVSSARMRYAPETLRKYTTKGVVPFHQEKEEA